MNDIFTNLYNKVVGFFKKTDKEDTAKDVACSRLRVVLMQDRTNLTPELMERMRKELVDLLSKYVEMDKDALELNLEQDGEQVALMLSIPVIRAKDEEEIEQALAESDAETNEEEKFEEIENEDENISEDEDNEEETSEAEILDEDLNAAEDEANEENDNKTPQEPEIVEEESESKTKNKK